MKKKIIALMLVAAMSAAMFAGCGNNKTEKNNSDGSEKTASSEEQVDITYWTLGTRQESMEQIVSEFNEEYPNINIIFSYYDTDAIKDACKVAAQADNLPDMWYNWGGSLGAYYPQNGCSKDLTEYAAANGWDEKFNSGALSLCELGGQLSGYPIAYNVVGMFYRKDIFQEYGIEVPTTFEQFEQACATLKKNGVTPISTGGLYGWHTMRLVEQFVEYYAGADGHDELNSFDSSWDQENVIKALAKYQEFCEKGYFPEGFITSDPNDTLISLANGNCAMDIQGQWYDFNILDNDLDMDQYGWFPFPNETGRMSAFTEMVQFNADMDDAKLDACMKFMDFMETEEHAAADLVNNPLPFANAVMPGDERPHVSEMYEYSNEGGTFTITDQAFPTAVADVLFDGQAGICNGTESPEKVAAAIQSAIEEYKSAE